MESAFKGRFWRSIIFIERMEKMKVKRFITEIIALSMLFAAFGGINITAGAAEMKPPSKLVSVCYSPELDIYTAVAAKSADSGNNLVVYSSGDGKSWVRSNAEINDRSTRIGVVEANGHYVNPNMIVWNDKEHMFVMGDMANVYTSADGINWTKLGTPKKYANINDAKPTGNIELYNMYFDGSNYWATTRINGEVARTIDGDLLKWYVTTLGAATTKAVAAITGTDSGKIYASSGLPDKGAYVTNDDGLTWNLAIGGNVGPYKTLGSVYSKYLDRLILVGVNGNKNTIDSTSTAAISFIDPATNASPEGNKIEMKNVGKANGIPGPAGDVAVSDDGSEIVIVYMNGDIYTVDTKVTEADNKVGENGETVAATPISKARDMSKYVKVNPKTDADDIGTLPLTGIAKGKTGYVAIGGAPGHKNAPAKDVPPEGCAVFIPNDLSEGYEKAVFYTNDTEPEAASAYIAGKTDEIAIERDANSAQFEVIVRDRSGAPMENTGKTFEWRIEGSPAGVTVADGLVTVSSQAQSGYIKLIAEEQGGGLTAEKTILLTAEPFPASIAVNGNDRRLVKTKLNDREYSFTAVVSDNYGRVMADEEVEWRIDNLEGGGVSVDENGVVTVSPSAQNGSFNLVAVSKTDSLVESSIELSVTSISGVIVKGPSEMGNVDVIDIKRLAADSLDAEGNGIDRTYTFVSTVFAADGKEISGEGCTYSIDQKTDYSENGVTLSTNSAGNAVITVSPNTTTHKLTLTAVSDNNDDVTGRYELHIVKSLVENSGFRKGVDKGSGWTINRGQVTPSASGGLALMRMNAAEGEEAIAMSDSFEVEAGVIYEFGFRSKVGDGMNNSSSMYATLVFCDTNGDPISFADVYDKNIEGKKNPDLELVSINGHQTAMEYYNRAAAPKDAVTAYVMLGVMGPVKNADFYDIGVYVLDNQIEVIEQYDYEITKFAPDGIVVEVKIPDDADSDDVLYVAAYNEQKELVKAYVVNDIQEVNSFETPEGASEVRAFIWDKFMKPLVIK